MHEGNSKSKDELIDSSTYETFDNQMPQYHCGGA